MNFHSGTSTLDKILLSTIICNVNFNTGCVADGKL